MSDTNGDGPAVRIEPCMHVVPGPTTFGVKGQAVAGGRAVTLHIEHSAGATVVVLPADAAMAMASMLSREATGIELAR